MPSPFPGMDPYIESSGYWGDFHGNLLSAIRGQLNAQLPRRFVASTEQYVWIHEPDARQRRLEPDIYVKEKADRGRRITRSTGIGMPTTIVLPGVERKKQRYVRVVDRQANRVVTVLELLSPANKAVGDARSIYLAKRNEYLASRLSLVELDLLRGGQRLPLSEPAPAVGDYYAMVCRAWEYPRAGLWSFTLRDPLPEVPVPLAPDVPDALLPLRTCLDRVYEEGRYATELDYDRPLRPRLRKSDAAWARELVASWQSASE
jgi:hypothetical protein